MYDSPAASAAASPPLDPPGVRSRFQGLRDTPKISLKLCQSAAMGGTLVLPRITAPDSRSRPTTVALRAGTWLTRVVDPAVVLTPSVSKVSLMVAGTPWNGPHHSPLARPSSAARARARAWSAVSVTMALTFGL